MKLCNVVVKGNSIRFSPTKKERGEAWSGQGFTEPDNVVLGIEAKAHELGATAKSVLDKCK